MRAYENYFISYENLNIKLGTKVRIVKLWPHARKQGHEIGQVWTILPPCNECGDDVIWLKGKFIGQKKEDVWTIDEDFLKKHFEVIG